MAGQSVEELMAENERLRMEADGHKEAAEVARKQAEQLESALKSSQETGIVSLPVNGSFDAEWKHPQTGKKMTQKVEFQDGRHTVILPKIDAIGNMLGAKVPSEGLLALANGDAVNPLVLEEYPAMKLMTQEMAAKVLVHYAAIKAGFLK